MLHQITANTSWGYILLSSHPIGEVKLNSMLALEKSLDLSLIGPVWIMGLPQNHCGWGSGVDETHCSV